MGMERSVERYILESFREKYHRSGRKEKSEILNEVCKALTCHRKHAIRLMKKRKPGRKPAGEKRGRKPRYDTLEVLRALHKVRRVMEYRNAEVIKENMVEWLPYIEEYYGAFNEEVRQKLLCMSASTMKRLVKRIREHASGPGTGMTRPGSILRNEIPIRTQSFWEEEIPGKMAADTVAHCGRSTQGMFIFSLDMVDPVTHWTAQRAVWGKGSAGILAQTKDIESCLPFPMTGLHVDNGCEFLNYHYMDEFLGREARKRFEFTRSRAYRKNDNAHVEQKNWSVVRRYFGYDRLDFPELVSMMNDLYKTELALYLNHFCRTFKLEQKIAIKSRYRRVYGRPETPYERVLKSPHVSDDVKQRLMEEHKTLNPVALKLEIERKLRKILLRFRQLTIARRSATAA